MTVALVAWLAAILAALAYALLTERLDYGSVQRRQLDAWAAISALVCLTGILYGGIDERQAAAQRVRVPDAVWPAAQPTIVPRLRHPDLRLPPAPPGAAPQGVAMAMAPSEAPAPLPPAVLQVALPESPDSGSEGPASAPVEPGWLEEGGDRIAASAGAQVVELPGGSGEPLAWVPGSGFVPVDPSALPTAVSAGIAILVIPSPSPTAAPPTPVPPTPQAPPPAPAPQCGDPNAMRVSAEVTRAEAERSGQPQSVEYRVRLQNESGFPVTLTGIVATAQDSRSGADQFGSDRKQDLVLDAGHGLEIEGSIKLERFPSPFGRSELCVSFVPETCGRRPDSAPVTRRCVAISGF